MLPGSIAKKDFLKLFALDSGTGKEQLGGEVEVKSAKSSSDPTRQSKEKAVERGKEKQDAFDQQQTTPVIESATTAPVVVPAPQIILGWPAEKCREATANGSSKTESTKVSRPATDNSEPQPQQPTTIPVLFAAEGPDSTSRVDSKRVLADLVGVPKSSVPPKSSTNSAAPEVLASAGTKWADPPQAAPEKKPAPAMENEGSGDLRRSSPQDGSALPASMIAAKVSETKAIPPWQRKSSAGNRLNVFESAVSPNLRDSREVGTQAHESKTLDAMSRIAGPVKKLAIPQKTVIDEGSAQVLSPSTMSSIPRVDTRNAMKAAAAPIRQVDGAEITGLRSPMAYHSTRLAQRIGGPELRLVVNSEAAGQVQLSTSLRQNDVQLSVNVDRSDVAAAMRNELPSLDAHLRDHTLRLGEVHIVAQGDGLSSGLGMTGQQQQEQREWQSSHQIAYRDQESAAAASVITDEPAVNTAAVDGRISVLA